MQIGQPLPIHKARFGGLFYFYYMPNPKKSIDTARAIQMMLSGSSYAEIGKEFGVDPATVTARLDELPGSAHIRAREASAEAWLDRGLEQLTAALDKGGNVDASAARAYEQACARRAALRNPAYRESNKTELTGPNGGPVQIQKIERVIVKH